MNGQTRSRTHHIILDLNGTIADTKRFFIETRRRFVDRLAGLTEIPKEKLLSECRAFLSCNSLHPDIAFNLPSVACWQRDGWSEMGTSDRSQKLANEIAEFRRHIVSCYRLDARTEKTLTELKGRGMTISVWSASRTPYVVDILLLLKLDGIIDRVFCPSQLSGVQTSLDNQRLGVTEITELDEQSKKPCSRTLLEIVERVGLPRHETVLVGNSILSDGISTIGTDVGFILLRTRNLTVSEIGIADSITGTESNRQNQSKSIFAAQAKDVHPICEISTFDELGTCI